MNRLAEPTWHVRHVDAWGLPVFGPDDVVSRVRERVGVLVRLRSHQVMPELVRQGVHVIVVPDTARCPVVASPLLVSTEGRFVRRFGHVLLRVALRRLDPALDDELAAAHRAARRLGLWLNTSAAGHVDEYFAHGLETYFGAGDIGPIGGDGVHNHINTRAALKIYDRPLFRLFERLYG
ncbi:hypothetical protein Q0Z83_015340 [Actinoplanes sichuanensis]|uniref:Uncharacterized protein n=1 Tax=Actinoplanes sichuanensis TaxID=512349 RepID=A0ABW4A6F9_9ACTN|nr:hypothetical protein [Actinoplanes sichuanensis]BEL03343.1 hypothetical protein Q0Z83_015340 [Actinoplanes sichuanensis]